MLFDAIDVTLPDPDDIEETEAPSLAGILRRAGRTASGDQVSVRTLFDAIGPAGFGPLLFLPAVAVVTPLSGIPGFSSICGILITLIALQWVMGRNRIWLPQFLLNRTMDGDALRRALDAAVPYAAWLDRRTTPRLSFLLVPPMTSVPLMAATLFGAAMPLLELVPFSSSLLGLGICLIAVAQTTRDGVLALVALAPFAVSGGIIAAIFL